MDGSAVVRCGIPDLGGGQRESLRAIVAEVLGLNLDEVHVINSDSQVTPLGGTVTATRGLYMSGNATKMAAENVQRIILEEASEMLAVPGEKLDLRDKKVVITSGEKSGESIPLVSLIKDPVFADFTFGAQAAEVEIDVETGETKLLKFATAMDVGQAINMNRVEGQLEGGAAQGIGLGIMEEYVEIDGVPITWDLHEYMVPTSKDLPDFNTIVLESHSGKGPYGAKGVGEPSVGAAAPAVVNAIRDATGIRLTYLPVTAERIFLAMKEKDNQK